MSSKLSELTNIINVIDNNIISMEISINIIFFLFKTNPNIPIKKRKSKWDFCFVTNDNRERVIKGIEKSVGRFFLYSIDANPEWEMQEKLMEIGKRYHLG